MSTMSNWVTAVARELGLDEAAAAAATGLVLDLTKDVAHGVARPAAPVTAFLVGLAAGGAEDPDAAVRAHAAALSRMAREWSDRSGD